MTYPTGPSRAAPKPPRLVPLWQGLLVIIAGLSVMISLFWLLWPLNGLDLWVLWVAAAIILLADISIMQRLSQRRYGPRPIPSTAVFAATIGVALLPTTFIGQLVLPSSWAASTAPVLHQLLVGALYVGVTFTVASIVTLRHMGRRR